MAAALPKAVTYAKNQKPLYGELPVGWAVLHIEQYRRKYSRPYAVRTEKFPVPRYCKRRPCSSIIYSLVETAKLNNLNIYAYLETVLLYMPDYKNEPEGIEELMPWSDMIQQSCQIKNKH